MKNPFSFLRSIKEKSFNTHSFFLQGNVSDLTKELQPLSALKENRNCLYVNKGFEKRAEKVSEIDFILKDSKGEIITDNKELDLVKNPNNQYTGSKFWKLATQYHDITGMAVIRKITNGKVFKDNQEIQSLELLNSAYVEIVEDTETGKIKSFRYSNPVTKKQEVIPYEQCIYWNIPDPINPNQPLPLLLAGILAIQTSNETEKQYSKTLKNGGSIDGLFRFKEGLNEDQVNTLKRDYAQLLRENKDTNVPLILGGDASFERVALSPQELQSIENKKLLLDDLIAITGVPKSLLGISSGETYANAETSYRIFLREVIKPLMNDLIDTLNFNLISDDYDLDFIDPTPENVEENLKKAQTGSQINALTLNEKRELLGLPAMDGGDEIDKPSYEVTPASDSQKKNLKSFNHPLRNEDYRDKYYEGFLKALTKNKKRFKVELLKFLEGQKERILNDLPKGKALKSMTKADFQFDVLNEPLEISYMTPVLRVMEDIAKDEGEKVAKIFKEEFYYTSEVDKMVDKRFNFFAKSINATTGKLLQEEFGDWFSNDESVADLSKRVSDLYDFDKLNKWRADTIVNTEVSTITNMAKGEAYKQLDIPIKIWVHRPGIKGGIRDDHAMMDGEERKMADRFSNGLMHPHDSYGDAGDVINCNCTW